MANHVSHQRFPTADATSTELAGVLDRLVAIDLDLEPICRMGADPVQLAAAADSISSACETLRTAISTLRGIVHTMDGGKYLAIALPRHATGASHKVSTEVPNAQLPKHIALGGPNDV
jgi:hypothetical protein